MKEQEQGEHEKKRYILTIGQKKGVCGYILHSTQSLYLSLFYILLHWVFHADFSSENVAYAQQQRDFRAVFFFLRE